MHPTPTTIVVAFMLASCAMTSHQVYAEPSVMSEAEIEAHLVQHRAEVRRAREREQLRQEAHEARLERQAAVHDLLSATEIETVRLPSQAEPGRFELDCTTVPTLDIALGMLPDGDEGDQAAAAPSGGQGDLAEQATNPIASLWQIQLQNVFVGESFGADGSANQFLLQPVIPWKLGLQQITRITVPVIWTPDFDGQNGTHTGLGDTAVLNFTVFDVGKGQQLGIGPSLVLPTASSDFTGQGKWQAGPALLYINMTIPKIQWGALVYQNWSFASTGGDSDRPGVSTLFLQPFITWHFAKGWYVSSPDIPGTINWNNGAEVAWPIGIKLGAIGDLGGQKVNAFIEPFYTLGKPDSGNEWGIKFGLSLLFPTKQ